VLISIIDIWVTSQIDNEQSEKANRDIHKENHSPMGVAHNQFASDQ
jgi:hypothetical protein